MAHYLVQVAYTPQAWAALLKTPQDRIEALKPVLQKMGGRFEASYFAFGEYDIIAILEMPGNVDAAAFALAAAAGGAVKSLKTTPLLSIAEGLEAMRKAGASGYKPPQS
jgi:uncharacterized protein with GYD domain